MSEFEEMKKAAGAEESFAIARSEPLAKRTSFGIGGAVDYFLEPRSAAGVKSALAFYRERGLSFFVLGGGTNVLAADEPETDAVIYLGRLRGCEADGNALRCASGERLAAVVRSASAAGLSGLEPLIGIPGTVGGACAVNAGGRLGFIGDVIEELETVTFSGRIERVPRGCMKFGYRNGPFRRRIITAVVLRLRRDEPEKIKARMRKILEKKLVTQPYSERSAGCVFKNPEGESAGALIDEAGLKGDRLGGAEISRMHANFIVNTGRARAGDVIQLIKRIQRRVYRTAGRRLRREIIFLK